MNSNLHFVVVVWHYIIPRFLESTVHNDVYIRQSGLWDVDSKEHIRGNVEIIALMEHMCTRPISLHHNTTWPGRCIHHTSACAQSFRVHLTPALRNPLHPNKSAYIAVGSYVGTPLAYPHQLAIWQRCGFKAQIVPQLHPCIADKNHPVRYVP